MAIIENGYNHSPSEETARRKAERLWSNNEIARRYRDELALSKENPPKPDARVITPSDEDIETKEQQVELQRIKRIKTVKELRCQVRLLEDVVRHGHSVDGFPTMAGYAASLRKQKRRLLEEKLRRLEMAQKRT